MEPRLQPIAATPQQRARTRDRAEQSLTVTGLQLRTMLGWGKDRFYAAVKAGRFTHLIAVNASSPTRIVYVKALALQWIAQTRTPSLSLTKAR